jgi:hypothetical protein
LSIVVASATQKLHDFAKAARYRSDDNDFSIVLYSEYSLCTAAIAAALASFGSAVVLAIEVVGAVPGCRGVGASELEPPEQALIARASTAIEALMPNR